MAGKHAKTQAREEFIRLTYQTRGALTVRGYAYQCLHAGHIPKMSDYWVDDVVGEYLRDARIDGEIPWEAVIENGRVLDDGPDRDVGEIVVPDVASWIRTAGADIERNPWEGQPNRILVISEKATIKQFVDEALDDLPVSKLTTNGVPSWTVAKKVADWTNREDQPAIILMVTDFDPTGMFMVDEDWPNRLERLGANVERIEHICITMEQVRSLGIEGMLLPASDKRGDKAKYDPFVAKYGHSYIEVDALDSRQLIAAIREAVMPLVDMERAAAIRERASQESAAVQASLDDLADRLDEDGTLAELADEHRRIIEEDFAEITADLVPSYPRNDDEDDDADEGWGLGWDAD